MPEPHSRKKPQYTPPSAARKPTRVGGGRWVAPAMLTCWILGLAWIVVYYLLPDLKYMSDLGNWNLAVGMGLIALGFVFSTKWE
ncbi:MAG: Cell division protein CrgA [uncultured Nocardioidaceae bacterium]|uniref:Cell division protein CrgA n=1 Tax=uncultured Nocardioidaceae bacterium TaxID=253824 RepID=A0A6J4N7R2_9ACTN|nr:MAG: Cell division protein CrgA [uncultured Nocardioidaceae bacterium]